jgi:hypothetical protein
MNTLKKTSLLFSLIFFTACGTETNIDTNKPFDMWDYMTSAANYEVEYDVYENNQKVDYYTETHRQFGNQYERESNSGLTSLFLSAGSILMKEPDKSTEIIRYLYLGDKNIFQSPTIEQCNLERFYDNYQNKGAIFHNVLQVTCRSISGIYQEFYYGYNEGIVTIYEENNGLKTEYIKRYEKAIF